MTVNRVISARMLHSISSNNVKRSIRYLPSVTPSGISRFQTQMICLNTSTYTRSSSTFASTVGVEVGNDIKGTIDLDSFLVSLEKAKSKERERDKKLKEIEAIETVNTFHLNVDTKVKHSKFYEAYFSALQGYNTDSLLVSGSLQDCILYGRLSQSGSSNTTHKDSKQLHMKNIASIIDVESALTLVVNSVLILIDPIVYQKSKVIVDNILQSFFSDTGQKESLLPLDIQDTQYLRDEFSILLSNGHTLKDLTHNENIIRAVQLLKFKLEEAGTPIDSISDYEILCYISSLFEPTAFQAIHKLRSCGKVPGPICHDVLLRLPHDEFEYDVLLEIYRVWAEEIRIIDDEKLYYLKQLETPKQNFRNRDLILPPAFSNLLSYALRSRIETLPDLIDIFLNQPDSPNLLDQISEAIWYFSIDRSGESPTRTNKYYKTAQSKLIQRVNKIVRQTKGLNVDATTILGVANLRYLSDHKKSSELFKAAQLRFDRWQLESFNIDGFEKVLSVGKLPDTKKDDVDELRKVRKELNVKLLCTSILLLPVNKENSGLVFKKLIFTLRNIDFEALVNYPELWTFIVVKLNLHSILGESECKQLWNLYLKTYQKIGTLPPYNATFMDLLIKNINNVELMIKMMNQAKHMRFDDTTLAQFLSRLYKAKKRLQPPIKQGPKNRNNLIEEYEFNRQLTKQEREQPIDNQIDYLGFESPVLLARYIFENQNKITLSPSDRTSTKLGTAYLLGESLFDPNGAYGRYIESSPRTQASTAAIASLFVATLRLKELNDDEVVRWNGNCPIDVSINQFEKHVKKSYGDDDLVYPTDALIGVYIKALGEYQQYDLLVDLLERLVELKYAFSSALFQIYLNYLTPSDTNELLRGLSSYRARKEAFSSVVTEYELEEKKREQEPFVATGSFKKFLDSLECNWVVVREWGLP